MSSAVRKSVELIETPAGDPAWWVGGHAEVKALLGDQRLGKAHPEPAVAARYSDVDLAGRPIGGSDTEYAEHTEWRRSMSRVFSPENLGRLTPVIRDIAQELAGELTRRNRPADLGDNYSTPLSSRVICILLGVPEGDVERFREWTFEGAQETDMKRAMAGIRHLMGYVGELIEERRRHPGDDVISHLFAARTDESRLYEGKMAKLLAGMLAFGRETPASSLDWGVMLLLTHPDQRELLRERPELVPNAVEEILRLFTPPAATREGLVRYAHVDLEVAGVRFRTGDLVLLDLVAANHDSEVFPDPERFDITRWPNPHLAFGHGFYMCNFTRLARAELEVGIGTLFTTVPTLRLAEPPDRLELKEGLRTGGLARLPVSW
jgi:pentalenolactone synthase